MRSILNVAGGRWGHLVLAAAVCLALVGCAKANPMGGVHGSAGFWSGLWHGMICPVAFVVSLFNHSVSIYEVRNTGNWYNFGFMLGAGAWGIFRSNGNRGRGGSKKE